jgi:hypothetical protein
MWMETKIVPDFRSLKPNLVGFAGLAVFSFVAAIVIYAANIFLIQTTLKLSLSQGDLLFIEGLVLVLFGFFVLITKERRMTPIGLKQQLLYGVPAISVRTAFPHDVVRVALAIVLTGLILIFLSFLA